MSVPSESQTPQDDARTPPSWSTLHAMKLPKGVVFAVLNHTMALAMCSAAALQWNDPDPGLWIAFYLAAAGACLQTGRWSRDWLAPLALTLFAAAWALHLAPEILHLSSQDLLGSMDQKGGAVEVAREVGGLVLCTGWMSTLVVRRWRAGPGDTADDT
ncbi:MAG TPA: hypothetical protein DIU15_14185 [Deltaproteobacteria bacterium]|nr:hypothetical protein [Deltaproteobacteria bacterium]HCP47187.1 hypothetical protein [Deltaproteobacteria bacterium]